MFLDIPRCPLEGWGDVIAPPLGTTDRNEMTILFFVWLLSLTMFLRSFRVTGRIHSFILLLSTFFHSRVTPMAFSPFTPVGLEASLS